jgi:hypothetical protein
MPHIPLQVQCVLDPEVLLIRQHVHVRLWHASPLAKIARGIASKLITRRMACARRIA